MRAAGASLPAQTQPRGGVAQLRDVRRALERLGAERRGVAVVDRGLERGRGDVPVEHARVRVVEDRRLDVPLEQRRRLAHEVLVERVLRGDEDREAVLAAAGASPLLAKARHRAGEADRDRAVEVADVDAELERVGGRDAEQVALDEPPLDLPPLLRRVAGAVRGQPGRGCRVEPVAGEAVDELRRLAALREADRAQAAADEPGEQPRRLAERARPQPELGVEERRVPERDRPLRPRRRVVLDHRRLLAGERAARARRRSRSWPRRAGTAARRRRSARAAAAGAGRSRRASRRRRGRRAPRPRRRSGGCGGSRPTGRVAAGRRCGACPGS